MSTPTSTSGTTPPSPDWHGVATEQTEVVTAGVRSLLQRRTSNLLRSLLGPHRRALVWLTVLIVVENLASLAGPLLVGLGIDKGIPPLLKGGSPAPLVAAVVALAVATLVQMASERAFLVLTARIGQDVVLDLRRRVFDHFQRLSQSFHETYTSGRVVSRQTSDIDAISDFLSDGLQAVVVSGLSILTIGIALFSLDVPLALVGVASFVPLVLVTVWFRRESGKAYRATREAVARVIVQFVETFGGLRAVQAFRREPRGEAIFSDLNDRYRVTNRHAFDLMAVYMPAVKLIGNLAVGIALLYGGHRVLDGDLQIGVLTSILLYLRRFFDPLQDLSQFFNSFQSASAALEKLAGVLDEEPAVREPDDPTPLSAVRGDLRLEGVTFGYGERVVLPRLDLHVPAGQTVALVGRTGAGKTTIARLVGRMWDPTAGTVRLDGVDLRRVTDADLHRGVVTVTQESFLFSGTVADNIAVGRPGATRAQIEEAAREIGAHEFITRLPEGYDTDVRARGGRLSAGQRQLVSFARAFLADPAVLILDEATSSLDIPSERLVQRALRTILADRTAIIIAHRLSTVAIADRVLVLEAGEVIEDGTPEDLIGGSGRYAALHRQWEDSLV